MGIRSRPRYRKNLINEIKYPDKSHFYSCTSPLSQALEVSVKIIKYQFSVRRSPSEPASCIPMIERLWPATLCIKVFTRLHQWTSTFPSDSGRWNDNIPCWLHEGSQLDCDFHLQDISPLSAGGKSCSTYPVSVSPGVYSFDYRYIPTPVSGSGEANPRVRPAGVIT